MVLAAAVQLEAVLGDIPANLAACELADEAGRAGAAIIALPEFFATGIGTGCSTRANTRSGPRCAGS